MPELTPDELDTLCEALEAWENKDFGLDVMTSMVDTMMSDKHGGMPPELAAKRAAEKRKAEQDRQNRKERSVLLRAKLLQIRDAKTANTLTTSALNG